jgi:cytochrome c heme-lyase
MSCPIQHGNAKEGNADCPVNHKVSINPDTRMPYPDTLQATGDISSEKLSTERTISKIPRADSQECWHYPSARMFYNALERKGKAVPADAVDDMLSIHNRLNEAVWGEIIQKERLLHPECTQPTLKRFMGRPDDLTLTAWWHVNVRGGERPFDRHDWTIDRCGCESRYIIDYYAGHQQAGEASFNVDIRPALDSSQSILDRFRLFYYKHFTDRIINTAEQQ